MTNKPFSNILKYGKIAVISSYDGSVCIIGLKGDTWQFNSREIESQIRNRHFQQRGDFFYYVDSKKGMLRYDLTPFKQPIDDLIPELSTIDDCLVETVESVYVFCFDRSGNIVVVKKEEE